MPTPSARFAAAVLVAVALLGRATAAAPRDELLRVAPPDAAFVLVVQNPRDHLKALSESPFAAWFPTTRLGKQLFGSDDFRKAIEGSGEVFRQLGVTPDELLGDVLGDAVVVGVTPGERDDRSVILVRPRKPDTLRKVIDRLNDLQKASGEVKAVVGREHAGAAYFERQCGDKPAEFYLLRGGVFAFSESEAEIRAVIDRERATAPSRELADRLTRLGVADAAVVLLMNPRPFDAQVRAKAAAAHADEKKLLATFEDLWKALDAAAVYLDLGRDVEAGVALRFRPDAVPAALKPWLLGPRTPSGLWEVIPSDALFAVAGRVKVAEVIQTVAALVPDDGKNGVTAGLNQVLGPVFSRDKLAGVLDALGPDWAVWAAPPASDALPTVVAALQVRGTGADGQATAAAIEQAVAFGFQMVRVAYNGAHPDQIDLRQAPDGDAVIRTLVNDKGFPAGFRPSFALKKGYLLFATSPAGIEAFRPPAAAPKPGAAPLARFSGTAVRTYLKAHRGPVAKLLSDAGAGAEKDVLAHLDEFAAVLELFDRIEVLTRGDDAGCRLTVRVTLAKPLKK